MAATPKQRAQKVHLTVRNTPAKPLGENGFKYREQFGVIVVCRDEKHQARTFEVLRRRGHQCKVVTV